MMLRVCLRIVMTLNFLIVLSLPLTADGAETTHQEVDRSPAMDANGPTVFADTFQEEKSPIDWNATYIGDVFRNFSGGNQVGSEALGLLALRSHFDLEQLLSLRGGSFFVHLQSTHGKSAQRLLGDIQYSSNIEGAANTAKIYELWYQQKILDGRLSLLGGVYDLNSEFYSTPSSAMFLNSSFGAGKDISQTGENGPSIFPTPGLAVRVNLDFYQNFYLRLAAAQAVPGNSKQPHGTHINYRDEDGLLLISELGYQGETESLRSKLAIGGWTYTKEVDRFDGAGTASNYGAYVLVENGFTPGTYAFLRYGFANANVNEIESNLTVGFTSKELSPREGDEFGLGLATALASEKFKDATALGGTSLEAAETSFEVTYRAKVTDVFSIQPDVQYVLNPGVDPNLKDALAGFLRFRFEL